MRTSELTKFIISVAVCLLAGLVGSFFTTPAIPGWYASLDKPWFTPPNQLFGPVWTALYVLMGVSAFLVWRRGLGTPWAQLGLLAFAVQLVLNVGWSVLFFGLRSPEGGFVEITILWVAILATLVNFRRVSRTAAVLLIPYLVWVSFAAILNFSIMRLNPR
ncbi:MAG: TspO/MBR family protein [Candidatus Eisenbacteria bacterium]